MPVVDRGARPAEEDVGRRLHHALADHDPLTVIGVVGRAGKGREHRLLRLLDLQQKRRAVTRGQQPDRAERPDTADPDRLERHVAQRVAVQQHPTVLLQCLRIGREGFACRQGVLVQMIDQRWFLPDMDAAVFRFRQAEVLGGTLHDPGEAFLHRVAQLGLVDVGNRAGEIDVLVPGIDRR